MQMSILPTISYKRRNTTTKSINTPISDKSGKETPMNSPKLTFQVRYHRIINQPWRQNDGLSNWLINKDKKHYLKTTLVFRYCEPCSEIPEIAISWYTSIATNRKTPVWNEANIKWIYIIFLTENQEINKETSYSFWIRWNRLNTEYWNWSICWIVYLKISLYESYTMV